MSQSRNMHSLSHAWRKHQSSDLSVKIAALFLGWTLKYRLATWGLIPLANVIQLTDFFGICECILQCLLYENFSNEWKHDLTVLAPLRFTL